MEQIAKNFFRLNVLYAVEKKAILAAHISASLDEAHQMPSSTHLSSAASSPRFGRMVAPPPSTQLHLCTLWALKSTGRYWSFRPPGHGPANLVVLSRGIFILSCYGQTLLNWRMSRCCGTQRCLLSSSSLCKQEGSTFQHQGLTQIRACFSAWARVEQTGHLLGSTRAW